MTLADGSVLVIDGPNLGFLEKRGPVYGGGTHEDLENLVASWARDMGIPVRFVQYDCEGAIISEIGRASGRFRALVVNPGGLSHTSVALMDAMDLFEGPVIEVHLSNPLSREPERRVLLTARAADAVICGAGPAGYRLALQLARDMVLSGT